MRWNTIIGQNHLRRMLQRCILSERVPQALLLTGTEGHGTLALALAFARTVNCASPIRNADAIEPCEHCGPCKQSSSLQHPNIRIVAALPTPAANARTKDDEESLSDEVIADIRATMEMVAADPYSGYRIQGATTIRIAQIRELKRSLSLSAVQEGRRVVIILNAEELNVPAANAFLKTLEEPHADTTIILTSSRPERLLPTIVSRCMELIVPPLDDEDVCDALVARGLCSADEAQLIAPFAMGDLQRAVAFTSENVRQLRDSVIDVLRTALKPSGYRNTLVIAIEQLVDSRDRLRADAVIAILATWMRDARAAFDCSGGVSLLNADREEAVQRFSQAFGSADLHAVLQVLERGSRDIARNVSVHLVLVTMLMSIRTTIATTRARTTTAK